MSNEDTSPKHVNHPSKASSPADHMIEIGKAGHNIKNGHSKLLDSAGLEVTAENQGDGKIRYSWSGGFAVVEHGGHADEHLHTNS